jgi:protein-arginine kinase activator protein McsA
MSIKLTDMDLECMECGSSTALLCLTLTDEDGEHLDNQMICRSCAMEKGFQLFATNSRAD